MPKDIFDTPMVVDTKTGTYVPQSHRHGIGRYAREAYGSKESCGQCMRHERELKEAQEAFRQKYGEVK